MALGSSKQPIDNGPRIGIFWFIGDARILVSEAMPLPAAEIYGDCLTYPHGHYEIWEKWRRLHADGLRRLGLPLMILNHEYEDFPRGRLVFQCPTSRFVIFADRKLLSQSSIDRIIARFGLFKEKWEVRADHHYRS